MSTVPGNRLCKGLNKSALDLWPNLTQQRIVSADAECSALEQTEIRKVGMGRKGWKFNPHAMGRVPVNFFFFEIRNRMCRTFGTEYIPLITKMS